MTTEKVILDACCGGRMFWFDKQHPNAIYVDNSPRQKGTIEQRPSFECRPDVVMDFTNLQFTDGAFKLVVWDPPHLKSLGETAIMRMKYGGLSRETWQHVLKEGFDECWRVLADYGVLVFKWNEHEIPLKSVLSLFHTRPLFGHPTANSGRTKWCVFMKIPDRNTRDAFSAGLQKKVKKEVK